VKESVNAAAIALAVIEVRARRVGKTAAAQAFTVGVQ
jgi:hypothetical protein